MENQEKNEFISFVCDTLDDAKKLFMRKNEQYATQGDALANFRTGALLRYRCDDIKYLYETAKDYEGKHIAQVYDNGIDGDKVDESLKDIIIYSAIELYMIKCNKRQDEKAGAENE